MVHLWCCMNHFKNVYNNITYCKSQKYFNGMILKKKSQTVSPLRGQWRLWGFAAWPSAAVMQHRGVNISTTLLGRHQCHHKSFIRMYLLNKVDASRLGAVEVCVYVTDQAPPCDLDAPPLSPPPSEKRVTEDTRAKTCNLVLGLLPLSHYYH